MLNKEKTNLQGLLEAIDKIEEYIANCKDSDELQSKTVFFDAILMNFIVIGEMVDRISDNFKETHSIIDWVRIKGFRNIIAHDYFGVDAEEVWQIATIHLKQLKEQVRKILKSIDSK